MACGTGIVAPVQATPISETPPPQPSVLVRLDSVLDPLDFTGLFGRQAPVEIELGSGDGGFLMRYAELHPERNFLGIERLLGRIRKLERKAPRRGLTNVRGLRIDATYVMRYLVPKGSVQSIHIYFPDPWPKKRHRHRRLVNAEFVGIARVALEAGGTVYLRTDDEDYFVQMRESFAADSQFTACETPRELAAVRTDFEETFLAAGKQTLRAAYRRVGF